MNNIRKIDGPTPSGGAYAVLYFYDDNNNPIPEEQATKAYGVEFDENGKRIKETYLLVSNSKDDEYNNKNNEEVEGFFGDTMETPMIR
jgi:hypothetical protein